MDSISEKPPVVDEMYEYSRKLDDNRDKLEPLPFPNAFSVMVGADKEPDNRTEKELALWQLISQSREIPDEHFQIAQRAVEKYPPADELLETQEEQEKYASLFDVDVSFDTYDVRFAKDLLSKINDGRLISNKQFKYIKYFTFRYRKQLEDQIIYEENTSDRLDELLGDDPRETFKQLVEEAKPAYDEINTRYDAQN